MAAKEVDLGYNPRTYAGRFQEREARSLERWLRDCQSDRIRFDPAYLAHLRKHHGGVPAKRYFRTARGTAHVVERFLNFARDDDAPAAQYRVANTWGLLEERLGTHLVPFADLFAGDFLCFDYARAGRPRVVVWIHEVSGPGEPHTELVARDFDAFLGLLSDEAAGTTGKATARPRRRRG